MKSSIKSDLKRMVPLRKVYFDYIEDINASLLFSQLVYWRKRTKNPDGWVFKSQKELQDEVFLTPCQQRRARKILKDKGLIEEKQKGVPRRLYFRVLYDPLEDLNDESESKEIKKVNFNGDETSSLEVMKSNNVNDETKQHSIIGENTTKNTAESTTYADSVQLKQVTVINQIEDVFQHWKTTMNKTNSQLDNTRKKLIKEALMSGYSVEQLCQAISGCAVTPHNIGHNERGQRYDGLNIILKNADQIDRFITNYHSPPLQKTIVDSKTKSTLSAASKWLLNNKN